MLQVHVVSASMEALLAVGLALVLLLVCCVVACCHKCGCASRRSLSKTDVEAFKTFTELYRYREIELGHDDMFEVEHETRCYCWRVITAKQPARDWAALQPLTASSLCGPTARIHDALLAFQYCVVQQRKDMAPHYPSFIVAQEWREWTTNRFQHLGSIDVQAELLAEVEKRLKWLDEVELGLRDPGINDLHDSFGWDSSTTSLLDVFTNVVTPALMEIKTEIDRRMLEASHAELMRTCATLARHLAQELMRFMECLLNTKGLRVESHIATMNIPVTTAQSWEFLLAQKAEAFKDVRHVDALLYSWYHLTQSGLDKLHDVERMSQSTETWDGEEFVRYASQFDFGFNFQSYLKAVRSAKHAPGAEAAAKMKALRAPLAWQYARLKTSLDPSCFGLDPGDYDLILEALAFFFDRTAFAIWQMTAICFFQSDLAKLVGRLYIFETLSKDHILDTIDFASTLVSQLRYQVDYLKQHFFRGWQNLRRNRHASAWSSTEPLDNFRLAMHSKKTIDQLLDSLHLTLLTIYQKTRSAKVMQGVDREKAGDSQTGLVES